MPDKLKKPSPVELALAAPVVIVAALLQIKLMGSAVGVLSLGLIAAYALWAVIRLNYDSAAILPLYLTGIAVQCLHCCEEYLTGFQRELPRLLGYEWSDTRFVVFNLIWLSLLVGAAAAVQCGVRPGYLIVIFFALAGGIGNGLGHLALSIAQQRYFPGTLTAPLNLMVGALLPAGSSTAMECRTLETRARLNYILATCFNSSCIPSQGGDYGIDLSDAGDPCRCNIDKRLRAPRPRRAG
jgi:hypothetical protein